ncbi:MAG TPA: RelA/SpoT family protein [bacterium]|nr:RelA/SpoT family protein [bacterium]
MNALRDNLLRAFRGHSEASEADRNAFIDFLIDACDGKTRETGEPCLRYISDMALRISRYTVDQASLYAVFLWNLLKLDASSSEQIRSRFGNEVHELAHRLVQLGEIDSKTSKDAEQEKFRRLILALARDIRVVFLRLLDRAHVLSKLAEYPTRDPETMARTAREIYAPLANRLGIGILSSELEDVSLRVLEPEKYSEIRRRVRERSDHHEMNVERIKMYIQKKLDEQKIRAEIKGRIKSINSIYKKMQAQKITFSQVYDVIGIRIITERDHVQDCYGVLGIVHSLWKPIPHRFKDFIAVPKENGYQSIHTSVIGPTGAPLEIQIRSRKMDAIAEFGLAAHWQYKESGSQKAEDTEKFTWMRKVMTYLTEDPNPSDIVEIFKVDMFPSEVYVFTPRGDVKSLPAGSTPVDFAFSIHSEVGFHCKHAKINSRLVPLRTKLSNGDIVEIITSRNSHPNANWLTFVRTSSARNKIRSYLREEARDTMIKHGMELLRREFKRHRIPIKGIFESGEFGDVVRKSGFSTREDLFAAIGFGEYSVQHIVNRLITARAAITQKEISPDALEEGPSAGRVRVLKDMEVPTKFARCCEPVPGDKIVGYITHGRGITIHKAACRSLRKLESARIIDVSWEEGERPIYPERIIFDGFNRDTLLVDITRVLVNHGAVIRSQRMESVDSRGLRVRGVLMLDVQAVADMDALVRQLETVDGVREVTRSRGRKRRA